MNDMQQKVKEWMIKAEQECPNKPGSPNSNVVKLRMSLISEEAKEFIKASVDQDLIEISDALGDLLYVVIGSAIAYGIDIEPIFNEIHRSNMSKFIDGHKREDGKWMKGPSFVPPNLGPILLEQSKVPSDS